MPPTDQADDVEHAQAPSIRYGHVVKAISEHPWAILPSTLDKIVEIVRLRASGGRLSDEEIKLRIAGASAAPPARTAGRVQIIPIFGVIAHRMNMFSEISGGTSTEQLGGQLQEALNDSRVSAILFDIDSPGGSVQGIQELADAIFAARGRKPIVAYVNATCASAAYWLASQCDQISVTPSGQVGSIGVVAIHEDLSKQAAMLGVKVTYVSAGKFKTEGQPFIALTDEAKAAIQALVDGYYEAFVGAVARGRAVDAEAVRTGFGEGRMAAATAAREMGMVDRIETIDRVLARLNAQTPTPAVTAHPTSTSLHAHAEPEAERGGKRTMDTISKAAAETVDPDSDGKCPEGYSKGADGKCHMLPGASASSADGMTRDGEIIVKLSEITALRAEAAKVARIAPLEEQLEREKAAAAEFVEKQRDARIAFKIREVKIPAFRAYVKGFYDMALRYAPEAARYSLIDPKITMTAEEFVDSFVDVVNKQADVLFKTLSVDTKPVDPNEPEQISAKIEYRVNEYVRHNKLDRKKDYKTALHAVLDADPVLKDAYSRS